jgi:hypothetical protein
MYNFSKKKNCLYFLTKKKIEAACRTEWTLLSCDQCPLIPPLDSVYW